MLEYSLEEIVKIIIPILKANNVSRASIFGSVLERGTSRANDIDLLVKYNTKKV